MAAEKDSFIVLDGKAKTFNIASRRVGSEDRYAVVATATSETLAMRMVKALAHMQGDEVKLDLPNERLVKDLQASLSKEREAAIASGQKLREAENQTRIVQRELDNVRIERNKLQIALAAAQDANREKA